jgi:hypothetical protein
MFSSSLLAVASNTFAIGVPISHEDILAYIKHILSTADKVGFVTGGHLQNDKGDLFTCRPAMLALFKIIHGLRCKDPSNVAG